MVERTPLTHYTRFQDWRTANAGSQTQEVCIDHRETEKLTLTITISRGQGSNFSLFSLTNEDPPPALTFSA